MAGVVLFTFILVECLSDAAISRVNVSGSTATGGVDSGIMRARAVDVRGGVTGAGASDVANATTAAGVHGIFMGSDIFPNDLLLSGVECGRLEGIARGRAKVSGTTTAGREDLSRVTNGLSAWCQKNRQGLRWALHRARERFDECCQSLHDRSR
jgi:hypothetical protein